MPIDCMLQSAFYLSGQESDLEYCSLKYLKMSYG